jgi:hypothetical protein
MISISPLSHPALGPLLRLEAEGLPPLRLMPAEAATIARALDAVRHGRSAERTIYLSPMADDGEFLAEVEGDGLRLAGIRLGWDEVEDLAARLAAAGTEG